MNCNLSPKLFLLAFGVIFFLGATAVRAEIDFNLSVAPAVIDLQCEKGRICTEQPIAITNNSTFQADVYPLVNDLNIDSGLVNYADPSQLPADASLTRWIDFNRSGVTIKGGQTATQTLRITASPNAIPGKYHAVISFPVGNNLTEAIEADKRFNQAKITVNLEIIEHKVEQAEITLFKPKQALFTNDKIGFILKIKNLGNSNISPSGEIIIYNKSGKEVGSLSVSSLLVEPGKTKDITVSDSFRLTPGKHKARLALSYGQNNGKDLSDIIYFSYLPLVLFLCLLFILLALIAVGSYLIVKKRREKRLQTEEIVEEPVEEEYEVELAGKNLKHHKYVINLKK